MDRDLVGRLAGWQGRERWCSTATWSSCGGEPAGTVEAALDAHPGLTGALWAFAAQPGRQVIVVVGNHDAPIAWDGVSAGLLTRRLGPAAPCRWT
jgi:hypothetical protein